MRGHFTFTSRRYQEPSPMAGAVSYLLRKGQTWELRPPGAVWKYDDWHEFALNLQRELESRWSDEGQIGTYVIEAIAFRDEHELCAATIEVERP